ncbi:MAG TPA: hypothetical protein V6C81_00810 [Planktothrix sp.]|jgi:hypothetical protein
MKSETAMNRRFGIYVFTAALVVPAVITVAALAQAKPAAAQQQTAAATQPAQQPPQQQPTKPAGPVIVFVTPHAGDKIKDYPIFVETRVTGFTLASPVQYWDRVTPENRFIGHIHYTLDDGPIFATKGTHLVFGKPDGKILPAGTHILRAELVNINHNSLNPPVYAEIPLVCEHGPETAAQTAAAVIPIDAKGRKQLAKVEEKLHETEKEFAELKSHLKDVQ